MLSEDTGTQGQGNAELELGYAWSRLDGTAVFLFQPQLSYGTSSTFDLIVQPAWIRVSMPGGRREKGPGDTNLDFKWRFYGAAPWSLGVRAGLQFATAQADLGLPEAASTRQRRKGSGCWELPTVEACSPQRAIPRPDDRWGSEALS